MRIVRQAPTAIELGAMYQEAGWIDNPEFTQMQDSVISPSEWFVMRDNEQRFMGMGRLVTDYVRYGFIVDVIVKQTYQKQGIGKKIVDAIVDECRRLGLASVNLWPSEGNVKFYESRGFYALPSSQPHMKLKAGNK